jgi:tRNA threonylcarbamoyladenosine biosynthesis protein TsaE
VDLGRCAEAGHFIACCGPLGAGKTTFIQGFAEGLGVGVEQYVRSPTFTLIHEYRGRFPLYHFDFYRLSHFSEALDIGFADYLDTDGVIIVEWAEKFLEILPASRLDIHIQILACADRKIQGIAYDLAYVRYVASRPEDCVW